MYYADQAIQSSRDDRLGRTKFAMRIADSILDMQSKDCFAVALQGKWGCGKTSIINMILAEIERINQTKDIPIVHVIQFNPWNFTDTSQLLNQFFIAITSVLKMKNNLKKAVAVGEAMERYAAAFEIAEMMPIFGEYLKFVPGILNVFGKRIKELGDKANDISYQKLQVEKTLKEMNGRLLIVIDDIDRLPDEQIRLIFQLVNSVAGFPNTTYLLSYDPDIAAKALDGIQGKGSEYLEKIIQVPFEVPPINPEKLRNILEERVKDIIHFREEDVLSERQYPIYKYCVEPFMKTLRDVIRFCNVLAFSYAAVKDEVNAFDMMGICSLQVLAPSIFDWIREHKFALTKIPQGGVNRAQQEKVEKEYMNVFRSVYEEPEKMMKAVSTLFPNFGHVIGMQNLPVSQEELHSIRSIADGEIFDMYFTLSLEEVKIPRRDLKNAFGQMDEVSLDGFLSELEREGRMETYMKELSIAVQAHRIPAERVEILAKTVLPRSYKITSDNSMEEAFSAYDFLDLVRELRDERKIDGLLNSLFREADFFTFQYLLHPLHIMELSYGRVGNNQALRNYQIITMTQLFNLEKTFLNKLKDFLSIYPILDWDESLRAVALWRFIAPEDYETYMKKILVDDVSAAKFLGLFISPWYNGKTVTRYSLKEEYTELLSSAEALEKIQRARLEETFWSQGRDLPERTAAYMLLANKEDGDPLKVKGLVTQWYEEYSKKMAGNETSIMQKKPDGT